MRITLLLCVCLMVGTVPAIAQSPRELGTTTRGRITRDASAVASAQAAVDRAGLDCRVTNGVVLGRDSNGATHYEVACASDDPGLIVIGPPYRSISCLALEANARTRGSTTCQLPANRNTRRHYVRMASSAGIACEVQEGRLVGQGTSGAFIYEINCTGPEGYWIEPLATEWLVTDCLTVRASGGECSLTSRGDDQTAFASRLQRTELATCDVSDVRAMGRGERGLFFEVRCRPSEGIVARFDDAGTLLEVIPCANASLIGDGCRLD